MDAFGRKDVGADGFDQRRKRRRTRPDPVGERRDIEIDAFLRPHLALPVERQMRPIFCEQNLRQKSGPARPREIG